MGMKDIKLVGMSELRADAGERPSLPSFLTRPAPAAPAGKGGFFRRTPKPAPKQQATFDFVEPVMAAGEVAVAVDSAASAVAVAGEALAVAETAAVPEAVAVVVPSRPVTAAEPIVPLREREDPALSVGPSVPRLIVPNAPVTSPPKRPLPAPALPVSVPRNGGKALVPTARRSRAAGVWMKRIAVGTVTLAMMASVAGGVFAVRRLASAPVELAEGEEYPSVLRLATARLLAGVGMKIGDVLVEGRERVPAADVLTALHVSYGEPIMAYDAEAARLRLENLPWVASATVERRLPDTLFVRLTERQPFALWQHNGKFHLVDAKGSVIETQDIAAWSRLPLVVGEGAPKAAEDFLLMLAAEPVIASRVKAAVRVGDRRWNLTLDGDVEIRLPEENPAVALGALADMERQGRLLEKDIRAVDLRIPDRMVVRLSPQAAERLRIVPAINGQKNG